MLLHLHLLQMMACMMAGASGLNVDISSAGEPAAVSNRPRTVDELLPQSLPRNSSMSMCPEWSDGYVSELPYGCECSFYRERYFCQGFEDRGYPQWIPRAASEGVCESVPREQLVDGPFPPKSRVLMYGNSHQRQVLEAISCMFPGQVTAKRVLIEGEGERVVPGDMQCRACSSGHPRIPRIEKYGCVAVGAGDNACRCRDDESEFYFVNGAVVHFAMAHLERNKSVEDAIRRHGTVSFDFYDVIIANPGNPPIITPTRVLDAAFKAQAVGVPFFWASAFDFAAAEAAPGNVNGWTYSERVAFNQSDAFYFPVGDMTQGLLDFTAGAVRGKPDHHFCLPGPPNEIGLLLLKMIWALSHSKPS